jgi:hypothetical protein
VRLVLDAHPDFSCPGETCLFRSAARFLEHDRLANDVAFGVVTGLGLAGFTEAQVLQRLRDLVFGFHRDHAARVGKPRWAEKTAVDAFHVDAIEKLCAGHVRYVSLVRHGLDVACSLQDLADRSGGYLAELHAYVQRQPRPLLAFAAAWADVTGRLLDLVDAHPDRALLVRFEDLLTDPLPQLQRLFDFLDAPWDPAVLDAALQRTAPDGFGDWRTHAATRLDPSRIGRHRTLPARVIAELAPLVNGTLARAGYPPVEVTPLPPLDDARRLALALRAVALTGGGEPDRGA